MLKGLRRLERQPALEHGRVHMPCDLSVPLGSVNARSIDADRRLRTRGRRG